jgi:N-acetylmuramoyl-L-alanine amidase
MSTNDLLAKHAPALRTGGDSLRRWANENELRAVAVGAYLTAVVVMLLLVVLPVTGGGDDAASSGSPASEIAVPNHYTVRENDTLAGIAERYGMTVEELRAFNPGIDPMALAPGSTLRLRESAPPVPKATVEAAPEPKPPPAKKKPASGSATPKEAAPAPQPSPPPPTPPPAQQASTTHTVAPGDTLTSIAIRYGTTVDQLLALNPGIDPYTIVAGQEVAVP